jgi:hypothetical protein
MCVGKRNDLSRCGFRYTARVGTDPPKPTDGKKRKSLSRLSEKNRDMELPRHAHHAAGSRKLL